MQDEEVIKIHKSSTRVQRQEVREVKTEEKPKRRSTMMNKPEIKDEEEEDEEYEESKKP
jgi:hypothetical protein